MLEEFYCKICEINCTGKAPFEQHLQSAKHIKKAQINVASSSSSQGITHSTSFPATRSDTFDNSPSPSSSTISSETMRILLEWNHPLGYKPYCDICHLHLHGGNNADLHFQGDNIHNQKLVAWKKIQEGDIPYSCKVCSEIFDNENKMRDHFISDDTHRTMIEQKDKLKKFIQIYQTYDKLKQIRQEDINRQSSISKDNLSNAFENLTIIDETKGKQSGIFSLDKLQEIMKKIAFKYDDDDDFHE